MVRCVFLLCLLYRAQHSEDLKERLWPTIWYPLHSVKDDLRQFYFEQLSVEESVGQVFSPGVHSGSQIDPRAKPILRQIIEDKSSVRFHRNAIARFVLEGDKDDLKFLVNYMESYRRKEVGQFEQNAIWGVAIVVAHMAVRDVDGADAILQRMCRRKYWDELGLQSKGFDELLDVDSLILHTVESYAITRRSTLADVVDIAVRETPAGERRKEMQSATQAEKLKAFADQYELRIYPMIPKTIRAQSLRNFNGDLKDPQPLFTPD